MGKYKESLETLRIANAINPGNSDVEYMLAVNYAALKQYETGLRHLRKSIYYNRKNPDPYKAMGFYYYETAHYDSALYYYTQLPDSLFGPEIYYRKGLALLKLGRGSEAKVNFDKYLAVGQDSTIIKSILNLKK